MQTLTGIVALNHQGVIGCGNALPWRLKADMRFFKEQTSGGVVLMGRKTFDSLGKRPLSNRFNVVVSHHFNLFSESEECKLALGIQDALFRASLAPRSYKRCFVIGGASMYDQFSAYVDTYLITLVDKFVADGDTHFCPEFEASDWDKETLFRHEADAENEASFTVYELRNRRAANIREARARAIERGRSMSGAPTRERPPVRRAANMAAGHNLAMF